MILADKIINERKKLGWSQEELADKLEVSRQSVSKWESAQSTPDLNRILKMAEIFSVSTDYLLKDNIDNLSSELVVEDAYPSNENIRKVSMEEATDFMDRAQKNAPWMSFGVSLCIFSPVTLLTMAGLSAKGLITENIAAAIGVSVLLVLVAIAVFIFIYVNRGSEKYEFLEKEIIETAYGIDGLVEDKKNRYEKKYTLLVAGGVILCILCVIPVVAMGIFVSSTNEEYIMPIMVALLLAIVSVGVNMIVRASQVMDSYNMLIQQDGYTPSNKRVNNKISKVSGIYWCIIVGIYLAWSFITMKWEFTWIIWPVSAVLFGALAGIIKVLAKED